MRKPNKITLIIAVTVSIALVTGIAIIKSGNGTGSDIKRKDDSTISYYNTHKGALWQMLDTLKVLHERYPGYTPVIIRHRNGSSNMHLTFAFSDQVREESISYDIDYSTDRPDSCEDYRAERYASRKLNGNMEWVGEDSCTSCSDGEKKMTRAFITDPCIWHALSLVKRSGLEVMRMDQNGFEMILDGPSMLEHGDGMYAFMYVPYSRKAPVLKGLNVTATIDSEVYFYHTDRN